MESESKLNQTAVPLQQQSDVQIEFMPELVGNGPRKHMMCYESGGIRIEFIWNGE